ncbi:MAG TPA: hypothetical protein CFH79_10005 [Sulfurospirillum sp. UBA11407]|nr:MAG TPA: hypothetical protein CFH79_10005 [Sulfurospirillum sp. UBA11407]
MYIQSVTTQTSTNITTIQSNNDETTFDENITDTSTQSIKEIIETYKERLGFNGNLTADMFLQRREDYIVRHEEEFKSQYPLYEKYKDVFIPEYSNYTRQKADAIMKELNAEFPDFRQLRHKAYYGGTQEDMDKANDMFMDYQAYHSYLREKYDLEVSNASPFFGTSPEGMRAYNLAVYDQLEAGVSLNEAKGKAQEISRRFGSTESSLYTSNFLHGFPESTQELIDEVPSYETDYDKQIDLREYGFEHNFIFPDYFRKFPSDAQGIKARIMYDAELYAFLMDNQDKVDKKIEELREKNKEYPTLYLHTAEYVSELKEQFKYQYDIAMYTKEFYEKYSEQIFENRDIKNAQKSLENKAQIVKNQMDETLSKISKEGKPTPLAEFLKDGSKSA